MKYMLFCLNCNNKVFTNGTDLEKFFIVPSAPLQKRGDGKNMETTEQKKKIKCPECGYLFKIVKLGPEQEEEKKAQEFKREEPKGPEDLGFEPRKKKK